MEDIKLSCLKNLAVYSLIVGAACAVLSLIPQIMPFFSLFFAPFLGCVIPFILLLKFDNFYSENHKTYILLGAISGFCLSLSYYFILIVLCFLIHLFFKAHFAYFIEFLNAFLLVLFFVMIAVIYVITNSVTMLLLGCAYKYLKGKI